MGWILSPTIPGYEGIPPSLSWVGAIPAEGLPEPPAPSLWIGGTLPGLAMPVQDLPTGVVIPGVTGPAVFTPQPSLGAAGPSLSTPAPAPAAGGGDSTLAMVLLLGLGALAVSRVKGLRL